MEPKLEALGCVTANGLVFMSIVLLAVNRSEPKTLLLFDSFVFNDVTAIRMVIAAGANRCGLYGL